MQTIKDNIFITKILLIRNENINIDLSNYVPKIKNYLWDTKQMIKDSNEISKDLERLKDINIETSDITKMFQVYNTIFEELKSDKKDFIKSLIEDNRVEEYLDFEAEELKIDDEIHQLEDILNEFRKDIENINIESEDESDDDNLFSLSR